MTDYLLFAGDSHYAAGGASDFVTTLSNDELVRNGDAGIARALTDWIPSREEERGIARHPDWAHLATLTDEGLEIVRRWRVESETEWSGPHPFAGEPGAVRYQSDEFFKEFSWLRVVELPRKS
ncbi:MAG: hypothetical protein PW734_08255 [Verrucomicrobium sp.]|nr:hypothetical protein [Verrucomicrobium sp.]